MPAKSEKQQRAMGMAYAAKTGKLDPSKLKGAAKQMMESMSASTLRDFAATKHSKIKKKAALDIDFDPMGALEGAALGGAGTYGGIIGLNTLDKDIIKPITLKNLEKKLTRARVKASKTKLNKKIQDIKATIFPAAHAEFTWNPNIDKLLGNKLTNKLIGPKSFLGKHQPKFIRKNIGDLCCNVGRRTKLSLLASLLGAGLGSINIIDTKKEASVKGEELTTTPSSSKLLNALSGATIGAGSAAAGNELLADYLPAKLKAKILEESFFNPNSPRFQNEKIFDSVINAYGDQGTYKRYLKKNTDKFLKKDSFDAIKNLNRINIFQNTTDILNSPNNGLYGILGNILNRTPIRNNAIIKKIILDTNKPINKNVYGIKRLINPRYMSGKAKAVSLAALLGLTGGYLKD